MKRRSFLGFLLAAPVAVPVAAKALAEPSKTGSYIVDANKFEVTIPSPVWTISTSANGKPTLVFRGDMICDGTITAQVVHA